MNILLIGDSRTSNNWGARGTTIAIHTLLSQVGRVASIIEGGEYSWHSTEFAFVGAKIPDRYSRFLLRAARDPGRRRMFGPLVTMARTLGMRDFVDPDPDRTADNIIKHHHRHPFLRRILDKVSASDAVVLNAEGDLVFTTPPRREALFLLGMVALCARLNKPVYFANALVSDCPYTGRNEETAASARRMFARCEKVMVRDPESYALIKGGMPEANCELVPDALFSWYNILQDERMKPPANGDLIVPFPERQRYLGKLDFSRPYVCIGGSAAASDRTQAFHRFVALVEAVKKLGLPVYLTENDGRDSFLCDVAEATGVSLVPVFTPIFAATAILANASLFISGRYHPSIMAALGGTPSIFLASVAHKMRSLQDVLEYPERREFPVFPSAHDIEEICILAERYLAEGAVLRNRVLAAAALRAREAAQLCAHLRPGSVQAETRVPETMCVMG
ncbi:polysaccharide pyruvyl transferase family protein [Petrachloros mirabilis]